MRIEGSNRSNVCKDNKIEKLNKSLRKLKKEYKTLKYNLKKENIRSVKLTRSLTNAKKYNSMREASVKNTILEGL